MGIADRRKSAVSYSIEKGIGTRDSAQISRARIFVRTMTYRPASFGLFATG